MLELLACMGVVGMFAGVVAFVRRAGAVARTAANPFEGPQTRVEYARRLLKHVERKTIAELAEGQAAVIRGRARAIAGVSLLRAHVSGVDAIGLNLRVVDVEGKQLVEEWACADFELVDATGAIRVHGAGVDVAIISAKAQLWQVGLLPPTFTPYYGGNLAAEGIIAPDTEVLVLGMVSLEAAPTDYRDGEQVRILRATETFPVAMSCDPDLFTPGDKVFTLEDVLDIKRG